ncbi:hypothetical protein [Spiroplasma citri]|uniref:Uncharacterized protein n=1 Tax=Spiroplasma citri TaxID=2133 RepID=Q14P46_SPICI|nr:hypothetical protein [Spiroplasma citri]APE74406.1 hypothetical protein SCITRI_00503 [Spiroplasma citri]QED24343.1 hypothetical protein FRX96_02360 [Spiroplasma citri]QIA66609.1 hypothetical protein GMI18_02355 [Spiroplasma citri]QIA68491.1 hypothetical protein GL298_02475 [Spiroplasma citri]QIA70367.1 hypothetical protein GL981_02480 [Spiroplasma citri]
MKFISEIKSTFKRSYKAVKKELNTFLKKLGFNKNETTKISTKIFDHIDETLETYVNSGINAEIDTEALEPIFNVRNKNIENNKGYNQEYANEYKKIFNEVNNFLPEDSKKLKQTNSKFIVEQGEEDETYSR